MILLNSKVLRVIAEPANMSKTTKGGSGPVHVAIAVGRRVVVSLPHKPCEKPAPCFAAVLTAKGWRSLPSMNVLPALRAVKGKISHYVATVYTDEQAAEAVQSVFDSASAERNEKAG